MHHDTPALPLCVMPARGAGTHVYLCRFFREEVVGP
jgi:hypothetical protein